MVAVVAVVAVITVITWGLGSIGSGHGMVTGALVEGAAPARIAPAFAAW